MAFDIMDYSRTAAPVGFDDLDLAAFAERPLSAAGLRCLRYMCDIESHTICYLRDLLVTPSHADPEVTTFLTMWAFEEYWHGEALAAVLQAHGIPTGPEHVRAVREGLGWRDRLAPIEQSVLANLVGNDFIAVHMTWGALNEWSTHSGYASLMAREDHPVLTELLTRIMRQESRHVAFYASQARERLTASRRAQRLTRFALKHFWAPVGSGVLPRAETTHVVRTLVTKKDARQLDEKLHRLPGLDGLDLVYKAALKHF